MKIQNQLKSNQTDRMNSPKKSGHFEITPKANIFETLTGVAGPVRVACGVEKAWTDQGSKSRLPLAPHHVQQAATACAAVMKSGQLPSPQTQLLGLQGPGGTS